MNGQRTAWRVVGVVGLVGGLVLGASGCRTASKITEVPRVDLAIEGGNRGYLVGTPPPLGSRKTTRQMVHTDVEIPYLGEVKATRRPIDLSAFGSSDEAAATTAGVADPAMSADTYVVRKGDSLWTIAAKPEIYGDATQWRRLYEANQDQLRSPDSLKAGMTLRVPRGDGETSASGEVEYGK